MKKEIVFSLFAVACCVNLVCHSQTSTRFWSDVRETYIDFLKGTLSGDILETVSVKQLLGGPIIDEPYDADKRLNGLDWPKYGYTMIGRKRLDNLHEILQTVVQNGVKGDFIECGVWRGGASIFARLVLDAHHQCDRVVYVADSFAGLPPSLSTRDNRNWDKTPFLEVPLEAVKHNFEKFGLSDENGKVVFIKGFFSDTLPSWRMKLSRLAVLRLDGDMYESCADIMANLYEKVAVGGYVIIDDWFTFDCKTAVEDFFRHHRHSVNVVAIDQYAAYFEKTEELLVDDSWYTDFLQTKKSAIK